MCDESQLSQFKTNTCPEACPPATGASYNAEPDGRGARIVQADRCRFHYAKPGSQ